MRVVDGKWKCIDGRDGNRWEEEDVREVDRERERDREWKRYRGCVSIYDIHCDRRVIGMCRIICTSVNKSTVWNIDDAFLEKSFQFPIVPAFERFV